MRRAGHPRTDRARIATAVLLASVVVACDRRPAANDGTAATPPAAAAAVEIDFDALRLLGRNAFRDGYPHDDVVRAFNAAGDRGMALLEEALRSGDGPASHGARLVLVGRPRDAMPVLLRRMQDPEPRTRERAAAALSMCADWWSGSEFEAQVVDAVLAGTGTATTAERRQRCELLRAASRPDERVVRAFGELLTLADDSEVEDVAEVVARLGPAARPLIPVLIARLGAFSDRGLDEPGAVLAALAAAGPDDAAVAAVAGLISDRRRGAAALDVLGRWGDAASAALPAIDAAAWSSDRRISDSAIRALSSMRVGVLRAVQFLVHASGEPREPWFWHDWDKPTRIADEADLVLPWLAEELRRSLHASRGAPRPRPFGVLRVLSLIDPARFPQAGELCAEAFRSTDPDLSAAAVHLLLGESYRNVVTDGLRAEALSHKAAAVRRAALERTFGGVKGRRDPVVAARLVPYLRDPDPLVVRRAGELIDENGAPPPEDEVFGTLKDLDDDDHDRRFGLLRALRPLGENARWAIPEMIRAARDRRLTEVAFEAIAATGELDPLVEESLLVRLELQPEALPVALRVFGARGEFLQDFGRDLARSQQLSWDSLTDLARGAADPEEFLAWMDATAALRDPRRARSALEGLGAAGLPRLVPLVVQQQPFWVQGFIEHVRTIGAPAAAPLREFARSASAAEAELALRALSAELPSLATPALLDGAESPIAAVRATALRGACDVVRAGAPPGPFANAAVRGLSDEPAVRASAFELLSLMPDVATRDVERARVALTDADAAVRVAAAAAVFARTKDVDRTLPVLRAELRVPAPRWGSIHPRERRPVDDYDAKERVWLAVARTLGSMGPAAAPAAEDLAWAVVRHGDPGLERRMLEALIPMGRAAAPAARIVANLRADPERRAASHFAGDSRDLVETASRVLRAIDPDRK